MAERKIFYCIQASFGNKSQYVSVRDAIVSLGNKAEATLFDSRMLAQGYLLKAKAHFRNYQFRVIVA